MHNKRALFFSLFQPSARSPAEYSHGATNPLAYPQNILKGRPIHWPIRGIFSRGDQSIGLSAEYSQGATNPLAYPPGVPRAAAFVSLDVANSYLHPR